MSAQLNRPSRAAAQKALVNMRHLEMRALKHDSMVEGIRLRNGHSKDNCLLRHSLPRGSKRDGTVSLKTDEVEIERFVGDRFVESKTGAHAVKARVFGYFAGKWQEHYLHTLYIEDVPEELLREHEEGSSSSSETGSSDSSPSKQPKQNDYTYDLSHLKAMAAFKHARTTYADRIVEVPLDKQNPFFRIRQIDTKAGVRVTIGGAVIVKKAEEELGAYVGLVKTLRLEMTCEGEKLKVGVMPYHFGPVEDPEEYFDLFPSREYPHALLQGDGLFEVDSEEITQAVHIVPQCFWERAFLDIPLYFLVSGHLANRKGDGDGGHTMVGHIITSPCVRARWAICLSPNTVPGIDTIKRTIQLRLESFLDRRVQNRGAIDAISLENVSSATIYSLLGPNWIQHKEPNCRYNSKTRVHEIGGTCDDFAAILGNGIKWTEVDEGSGLLVITDGVDMPEITLRFTPKRPGILLVVIGGLTFYGPPQPDGGRGDPHWCTVRCSAKMRASKRMRVEAEN